MFNLFTKSPEEKLKRDLTKMFDTAVRESLSSSPDELLSGTFITLAIGSCYKTCNESSLTLSRSYNLPINTVNSIIKECTNNTLSKYLDNAKDYFV